MATSDKRTHFWQDLLSMIPGMGGFMKGQAIGEMVKDNPRSAAMEVLKELDRSGAHGFTLLTDPETEPLELRQVANLVTGNFQDLVAIERENQHPPGLIEGEARTFNDIINASRDISSKAR